MTLEFELPGELPPVMSLSPRYQIKSIPNKLLAWVRACGAYFHHLNRWGDLPASLSQQHLYHLMVVYYDSVHYAGDYMIWDYWKHSSFHIKLWVYEELPTDAEIFTIITLKAPSGYDTKVEAYIGGVKKRDFEWDGGWKNIGFSFERPANGTAVNLIIRPITPYPVALRLVNIYVF